MTDRIIKILLTFLLCTLMVAQGALAAKSTGGAGLVFAAPQEQDEQLTITIATWYQDKDLIHLKAYLAKNFPEYNIQFEYIEHTNYEPILDSQLSYGGAADILYVTEEMAEKHAEAGYIKDVNELCPNFTSDGRDAFNVNGRIFAVPNTSQFSIIYYNKKLFKEKGVNVPTNLETFIGASDFLKIVRKIKPMSASLRDPYDTADLMFGFLATDFSQTVKGGSFTRRLTEGETSFLKEIYPYTDVIERLIMHGIISPEMYTMDKMAAAEEFVRQESAMLLGGPEDYNTIIRADPSMSLGVIPFYGENWLNNSILGGCDLGFAINAKSKYTAEAEEILKSLATYDGQEALWKDRPGSRSYLKHAVFMNPTAFDGIEEIILGRREYLPWRNLGSTYNRPVRYTLGREIQKVILKTQDMENAMKNVDKAVHEAGYFRP